jgi:hypothetical protein
MTDQEVRAALQSFNDAFSLLDNLYNLQYYLQAMKILVDNLHYGDLEELGVGWESKEAKRKWDRAFNQILMINDYLIKAEKFLESYEEDFRDKLCPSHEILTQITLDLSEDKSLDIPTNSTIKTCNMVTVDNYHPWD